MAKSTPRNFCKLDIMIWNHSGMRKLPATAALSYIYLIAYSKSMKKDGDFDDFAIQQCGASADDISRLIAADFVVKKQDDLYSIPKFREWQTTTEEDDQRIDQLRTAGSKGGTKRSEGAVPVARDERDGWMATAFNAWPAPGRGFRKEGIENVRIAFYDNVKTADDWEKFQVVINARLAEFENDPSPHDEKRPLIGSFQNFCSRWRENFLPPAEPLAPSPPPPPTPEPVRKEPAPFKVVLEEE